MNITIKKNHFYDVEINGERCYAVEHIPTGKRAVFDADDRVLQALVKRIEKYGRSITPCNHGIRSGDVMFFVRSVKHEQLSIAVAAFLFAVYHGLDINDVRSQQIIHVNSIHLPDGSEDCRSRNLVSESDPVLINPSRRFSLIHNGAYIRLDLTPRGIVVASEYFSNVPGLLDFLATPNRFSFRILQTGRVQAVYLDARGNRNAIYLNRLAWFFYCHLINADNFRHVLPSLNKLYSTEKRDIDHLNSNTHNHARWNLSCVSKTVNLGKKDTVARIKPPYQCFAVSLPSGGYRLEIGYLNNWYVGQLFTVACDDLPAVADCARAFMKLPRKPVWVHRACHPREPQGTPMEIYKRDSKAPWRSQNFKAAAEAAERLLSADDSNMIHWRIGDRWEVVGAGFIQHRAA